MSQLLKDAMESARRRWVADIQQAMASNDLPKFIALLGQQGKEKQAKKTDMSEILEKLLHRGAAGGKTAFVKALLDAGVYPNARNHADKTPLHMAAGHGHVACMHLLIEAGADIDTGDNQGRKPIHDACREGYIQAVRLLVAAGANPNATDMFGWTGVFVAALAGNKNNILPKLVDLGMDINHRDDIGWMALHWVAESNITLGVSGLLRAGADPHVQADCGSSALDMAERKNNFDVIKILLTHISLGHGHLVKRCRRSRVPLCR